MHHKNLSPHLSNPHVRILHPDSQTAFISDFGDARSDHHLLGRSNKKGMPLISLSAGIIRPFIFSAS